MHPKKLQKQFVITHAYRKEGGPDPSVTGKDIIVRPVRAHRRPAMTASAANLTATPRDTALCRHRPAPPYPDTCLSNETLDRRAMADFGVPPDLNGRARSVGVARSNRVRGTETILFAYDGA